MDINSNDRSAAEHKQFMQDAIAANPDVRWKTVVFHHSIYSTASHASDGDIIDRRNELPQIFDELDIDVVLMGHDHVYTRTYMMDGFTPDRSQGVQSSVTNPTGILYLTANSASGGKYYGITAPEAEYAAVQDQSKRRTVTNVEVTNTSYTMTTYFADDMSVLDTFTIYKTLNTADMESLISQAQGLNQAVRYRCCNHGITRSNRWSCKSWCEYEHRSYGQFDFPSTGIESGRLYRRKLE